MDKRIIDIRNIPPKIWSETGNDDIEEYDDFAGIIGEAESTKGLAFFGIFVRDDYIVSIPKNFNFKRAFKILEDYLIIVEGPLYIKYTDGSKESKEHIKAHMLRYKTALKNKEAVKYEKYTYYARGADDGTFDYAGTFMETIFDILEMYINQLKKRNNQ